MVEILKLLNDFRIAGLDQIFREPGIKGLACWVTIDF